jgi:hypothetical protein
MITIDGIAYDIPILGIKRKAEVLDKYAERSEDGVLHREILGVYFNYSLEIGTTTNTAEYARLWSKLTEPEEFHTVTVPDESGNFTFTAYFAGVSDTLRKTAGEKNYWKGLTVNFIARSPART